MLGAQQQARRLERAAGDDDDASARHLVRVAVGVEVAHAARRRPGRVEQHVGRRYASGRISQRPVRSALRSGATGSPLASIGQP